MQKHFSEDIVPKVENAATELTSVPRGEGSHSDSDMESKVADKQDTIQFGPKRTIAEIISEGRKGKRRRSKRRRFDDGRVRREAATAAKRLGAKEESDDHKFQSPHAVKIHYKHMALSFLTSTLTR